MAEDFSKSTVLILAPSNYQGRGMEPGDVVSLPVHIADRLIARGRATAHVEDAGADETPAPQAPAKPRGRANRATVPPENRGPDALPDLPPEVEADGDDPAAGDDGAE